MSCLDQPPPSSESVSYCINPKCQQRQNPGTVNFCQACGTSLLIAERYQLVSPLRGLDEPGNAELFEVKDWQAGMVDRERPKVLKVLKPTRHSTLIRLFQQEARVLIRLNHPGIPKVEPDGYFKVSIGNDSEPLHCLVMEKIEGLNLEQWVEENGSISQDLAINWLHQLTEILALIHRKNLFHRDIKPSNIMHQPDGKLVLIDFGTAREITPTLLEKLEGHKITRVISKGYTSPEQYQGQAIPKSDLFSLGRTFVYLFTGTSPTEFEDPQTGELDGWRTCATQISKPLADLIDQLMASSSQHRPQNPQAILQRLAQIQQAGVTALPETDQKLPGVTVTVKERIQETVVFRRLHLGKVQWKLAMLLLLGCFGFQLSAPQLAVTFNNRASDNYEAGQLDRAHLDIKLALLLNPKLGEAHYIKGLIADARQEFDQARAQYERAMVTLPGKAHNNLGRLDILQGDYSGALIQLQKGLQVVEEVKLKSALHKNLGWALLELGDYETAEAQLRQSISLDSKRASAYCLLAQVLEAKGDKTAGLQWKYCLKYAPSEQHLPEVNHWVAQAKQHRERQKYVLGQR